MHLACLIQLNLYRLLLTCNLQKNKISVEFQSKTTTQSITTSKFTRIQEMMMIYIIPVLLFQHAGKDSVMLIKKEKINENYLKRHEIYSMISRKIPMLK